MFDSLTRIQQILEREKLALRTCRIGGEWFAYLYSGAGSDGLNERRVQQGHGQDLRLAIENALCSYLGSRHGRF